MFVLWFAAASTALCILWVRQFEPGRSGIKLSLYGMAFVLLSAAAPVLRYDVPYSVTTDLFIAACVFTGTAGYRIVRSLREPAATNGPPPAENWETVGVALCIIGAFGNFLLLADAVNGGAQLSASFLINNAETLRNDRFTSAVSGVSLLATVGAFLAPCSYVYLAFVAHWRSSSQSEKIGNRWMPAGTCFLIFLVALFFYTGRLSIFFAGLVLLVGFYLRGGRVLSWRRIGAIGAGVVVLFVAATSFSSVRQQNTDRNNLLRQVSHASYGSDWLAQAADRYPQVGQAALQFSYFSSPLVGLTFYMNSGSQRPDTLYGQYSFPLPYRVYNHYLAGERFDWQEKRADVFMPMEAAGYLGNVWESWLRDLYVDWGVIGAALFTALFGALMAGARNGFDRTRSTVYHALETYAAVGMTFGAAQSLFYIDFYAYGLYLLVGLAVYMLAATPQLSAARARTSSA